MLHQRAQPHLGVMLGRLGDCALGLTQSTIRRLRRLGQRLTERGDEKLVALLIEREGGRLARVAYDAAGGGREALEMFGLAA